MTVEEYLQVELDLLRAFEQFLNLFNQIEALKHEAIELQRMCV